MSKLQTFTVPLYLTRGKAKKKNYWLTLSNYRNWKFHLNNSLKIQFKEEIKIDHLKPFVGKVRVTYTMYYPDFRLRDIDNSMAVLSKFTLDALVEKGILEDDNYENVIEIRGKLGGVEKANAHCVVEIKEIDDDY